LCNSSCVLLCARPEKRPTIGTSQARKTCRGMTYASINDRAHTIKCRIRFSYVLRQVAFRFCRLWTRVRIYKYCDVFHFVHLMPTNRPTQSIINIQATTMVIVLEGARYLAMNLQG
jgi:hypothetical protein